MRCTGKVALVTGAAGSGLGRSIALTLAREGATAIVNYRTSQADAQAVVAQIESGGGRTLAVAADVFEAGGCQALAQAALERFGRVDICVVGPGAGWHAESIDRLDPEAALEDIQHEAAPVLRLMRLLLPGMYERRWGRFIAIASHPDKRSPAYAYNAAKAARAQAVLLAQDQAWARGVTVNVIAPGPVEGIASLEGAVEQCGHGAAWRERPDVSPQDIAEGVAFLCSDAGRYVTGCVLPYLFGR